MRFTSYARNLEDVMLWRALSHINNGFYIDIGAQDPVKDSTSLAFYERGWQGVDVEPAPDYARLLQERRSRDVVVAAAVGNGPDLLRFFEIPGTGLSTADEAVAYRHRLQGYEVREIEVPCVTLATVFDIAKARDIHWLKIDVEGYEYHALSSWGSAAVRPWIIVVESTLTLTPTQFHEKWEPLLLGRGYTFAYFDGLNRYYISAAHPELFNAFQCPPNIFDDFELNGTASAPFHELLVRRFQAELKQINQDYSGHLAAIEVDLQSQRRRVADLSEELKSAQDQYDVERAQLQVERLLLATRASDAQQVVESQARQIFNLHSIVARMTHSLSWRITTPFRLLRKETDWSVGRDFRAARETFARSSGESSSGGVQTAADKPVPAQNLMTLLEMPDQGFLQSAYLTILGRLPDDDGLAHFGNRLRSGDSRMAIVRDLYRSKEARNAEVRIPWLSRAIFRYRLAYLLLLGFARRSSGRTIHAEYARRTEHLSVPPDNGEAAEHTRHPVAASTDYPELDQRLDKAVKEQPAKPDIFSGDSIVVKRVLRELHEAIQNGQEQSRN
jgi:FkbM family methyltransferase